MPRSVALLALALPFAALAQSPAVPPAPPEPPAPAAAAAPPAEPAPAAPAVTPPAPAPAAAAPAPKPGVVVEWGGWLQTHAWRSFGGVNPASSGSTDLPLFANADRDAAGVSARQSRLRASITLPADGLLSGARLKGLAEVDFMGPLAGDDPSLPAVRLRHAWVAASWKQAANLTVLAGQSWGVFTGPHFATSLSHLAVPRFGGAGFLYRRAPQVRLSAEGSGLLAPSIQLAALAPYDKTKSANVLVGERSAVPDLEGRAALALRPGGKQVLEMGFSGRYGEEVYFLDGPARDETIESWGLAADVKLEVPYLTAVGGAWMGEALGVYASIAPEVRFTTNGVTGAGARNVAVDPVRTKGFWGQGIVTPFAGVQLVGGYGLEQPEADDLPLSTDAAANAKVVRRNEQVSGALIVNLTSRWRVSGEVTRFFTTTQDRVERDATLVQMGTLYAF